METALRNKWTVMQILILGNWSIGLSSHFSCLVHLCPSEVLDSGHCETNALDPRFFVEKDMKRMVVTFSTSIASTTVLPSVAVSALISHVYPQLRLNQPFIAD